jgi:hypothetical protein
MYQKIEVFMTTINFSCSKQIFLCEFPLDFSVMTFCREAPNAQIQTCNRPEELLIAGIIIIQPASRVGDASIATNLWQGIAKWCVAHGGKGSVQGSAANSDTQQCEPIASRLPIITTNVKAGHRFTAHLKQQLLPLPVLTSQHKMIFETGSSPREPTLTPNLPLNFKLRLLTRYGEKEVRKNTSVQMLQRSPRVQQQTLTILLWVQITLLMDALQLL